MKKKILIFSGTHPRHLFVNSALLKFKDFNCKVVVMKRENLMPVIKKLKNLNDQKNLIKHFKTREIKEKKYFGNFNFKKVFKNINYHTCHSNTLNSNLTFNFVKKFNPDFTFIFGVDLIKEPILKLINNKNLNLHLGLSPWYKGSATLFWPFYFLEPNLSGSTFHEINNYIDEGPILHHSVAKLKLGQGIHDVANEIINSSKKDLIKIFTKFRDGKKFKFYEQKKGGKTFYTRSFKPYHLRVIYNLFNNKIVDFYLKNKVKNKIKLIKFV